MTPLPRPAEAGKEDSGVINLKVVQASATPQQVAAAEAAVPGQQGLFDDDKTVESAASPGQQPALAKPTQIAVVAAKKSNAGPIAGLAIAALGIAAAFAIISRKPPAQAPTADTRPAVAVVAAPPPTVAAAARRAPAERRCHRGRRRRPTTPPPAAEPRPPSRAGGGRPPGRRRSPRPAAPGKDAPPRAALGRHGCAAAAAGKPGDLQSEMARAVGPVKDGDKSGGPTPEPAAARPSNQNIPEQPSQGSVQAAVLTVMGGAKGCVAGADDVSRAQVTFSSNGAVTGVSVTGWAAAHGKSACVQAALKGAKVGPFSKSSFSVGVPIRP